MGLNVNSGNLGSLDHVLFKRSFELVLLTLVPYQTLNLSLGFDSKPSPVREAEDKPLEQDDHHPNTRDETRRHVLPTRCQNLIIRTSPRTAMIPEPCPLPAALTRSAGNNEASADAAVTGRISVGEFVRRHCPTLFRRWEPSWWLNRYNRTFLLINSLILISSMCVVAICKRSGAPWATFRISMC